MEVLTPFQKRLLKAIGSSSLGEDFYLTGGTALSAFYLKHRYSDDLDFFTADPTAVTRTRPVLEEIAQNLDAQISFTRILGSFLESFFIAEQGEEIKVDFAQESPYRLQPTILDATYNIHVDNLTDIACNKLSALFDRAESKDFVDVYFICQETMSFEKLEALTRQKHVGMDDYWLAIALQRVRQVSMWPRMIKPLDSNKLQAFFLDLAQAIMRRLESNNA